MTSQIIRFPETLSGRVDQGHPHVRFSIASRNGLENKFIHLFVPNGFTVPDGAGYNQFQLGAIGGTISAAGGDQALSIGDSSVTSADFAATGLNLIKKSANQLVGQGGAVAALRSGIASNPYTSLTFEGTIVRSYTFEFKLMPSSEQESRTMKEIEQTFREYMYPEESGFALKYPPTFNIKFYSGAVSYTHLTLPTILLV